MKAEVTKLLKNKHESYGILQKNYTSQPDLRKRVLQVGGIEEAESCNERFSRNSGTDGKERRAFHTEHSKRRHRSIVA